MQVRYIEISKPNITFAMPEDNRDGPFDRLAKSLFASPNSPFTAFADKQRSERLGQCKELEDTLLACQKSFEVGGSTADKTVVVSSTAKSRSEVRIKRFFKWNDPQQHSSSDDTSDGGSVLSEAAASIYGDGDSNDNKQMRNRLGSNNSLHYSKGCIRETHEMWACRALALGCGNHLSDLRRCWSDAASVLNKGEFAIKVGDSGSAADAACRGIQQQMARCVSKNAAELKERMEAAKTKQ